MSDALYELAQLSKEALSVLTVLRVKAEGKGKAKVEITAPELSRLANIGIMSVEHSIDELVSKSKIVRSSYGFEVEGVKLAYKADSSDEKKLAALELEYTELAKQLAEADVTRLQNIVRGEYLPIIQEIEDYMQRPLQTGEALYLGILFGRFGGKRVLDVYRQMRDTRFPIRATWTVLNNKARGSAFAEKSVVEAAYKRIGDIRDI